MDPRLPKLGKLDPGIHDPEEGYPSFSDLEDQETIPAAVRVPEAISSSDSELDERRPSISWNLGISNGNSERKHSYATTATLGGSSSSKGSSGYKSGSNLSVPKSNHSNSDSEHSYSTIASLRKQQLLAERRLQLTETPASKVGLPSTCFVRKTVPSYGDESRELYKTKHYLSSTAFMDNFSVVFADMLAKDLGFLPLWTEEATVCGGTISVKTTTAKLEITPTVRCKASWPEKAVEWIFR